MLELTGYINGEQYDNKVVDPEKLLTLLDGDVEILKKPNVTFKLEKNLISPDPLNKREKFANKRMFAPVTSGTFNGNFVTVRYYKSKSKDAKGNFIYTPKRVSHVGKEMKVDLGKQKEEAVFLYLNAACSDSPLKGRAKKYYGVFDKHKNAEARLSKANLLASLTVTINNMPDSLVRRLSHGLKLSGVNTSGNRVTLSIKGLNEESVAGLKAQLVNIATELPNEFQTAMNDQDLLMRGMIKEAKADGIIVMENEGRGVISWKWRNDIEGGAEILRTRSSQEPYAALYKHVMKSEVFDYFTSTVNQYMGYDEVPTTPSAMVKAVAMGSDINDMNDAQLIDWALVNEMIYYDRSDNKVYAIVNGEKDVSLHVATVKDWKSEFLASMDKSPIKRNKFLKHVLKK